MLGAVEADVERPWVVGEHDGRAAAEDHAAASARQLVDAVLDALAHARAEVLGARDG